MSVFVGICKCLLASVGVCGQLTNAHKCLQTLVSVCRSICEQLTNVYNAYKCFGACGMPVCVCEHL